MARKAKEEQGLNALLSYGSVTGNSSTGYNPKSLENLHPRAKSGRAETKFMTLNIIDFEDYLNRMSKYNGVSRTRYIQDLIREDMLAHKDEYEALKKLPRFVKKKV